MDELQIILVIKEILTWKKCFNCFITTGETKIHAVATCSGFGTCFCCGGPHYYSSCPLKGLTIPQGFCFGCGLIKKTFHEETSNQEKFMNKQCPQKFLIRSFFNVFNQNKSRFFCLFPQFSDVTDVKDLAIVFETKYTRNILDGHMLISRFLSNN
jgi:hypothetical protein